jgi:hypothetical protein
MVAWDIFHGNNLVERHDPHQSHLLVVIFGSSRVLSGIAIRQDDSPNRKDKINITSPTLEGGEARTFLHAHVEPGVL